METMIPADDPVRLLSAFVEGMDLSELYATYDRVRKNQATPRQMLKIMIYASMNHLFSSRDIEIACKRDINFMFLLEGMPAPDHSTIARFISIHLSACSKTILTNVSSVLHELGEISGKTIFIDGTKIESCANKYTFVWKKSVTKSQARLFGKIISFIEECEAQYGIKVIYSGKATLHTMKRVRKKLYQIKEEEKITFVYGIGHRKSQLQKSIEMLEEYTNKLKEYTKHLHICGERNSYSKTDPDATFMRMKEDAMLNGQLKPAYNLQHGVDAQYITWVDLSHYPNDAMALIPFLKDMESHLPFKYREIVADAGYESEEAYVFLEQNGQESYLKPQNYEISKSRKYRQDISRRENMKYDPEMDEYICSGGKRLRRIYDRHSKNRNGYVSTVTIYECESCQGCLHKDKCIHGNNCKTPMEKRNKRLNVSKVMKQKRQETFERITTEYGTQLRMNRSIQAEGSFAVITVGCGYFMASYRPIYAKIIEKARAPASAELTAHHENFKKLPHPVELSYQKN